MGRNARRLTVARIEQKKAALESGAGALVRENARLAHVNVALRQRIRELETGLEELSANIEAITASHERLGASIDRQDAEHRRLRQVAESLGDMYAKVYCAASEVVEARQASEAAESRLRHLVEGMREPTMRELSDLLNLLAGEEKDDGGV